MNARYEISWCSNCDKRPAECRGLCLRCYKYEMRHGCPRPRSQWDTARTISFCHCGGIARRGGLCFACVLYRHRHHGQPRPPRLFERPRECKNCKAPLSVNKRRDGVCEACYRYQRRHGLLRPPRLWGCDSALGWCECGRPAVERRIEGGHDFAMGYCTKCLEMIA
jgi:hypothetical protein